MSDSIGFKILKGILVVVIPILFILTFSVLFLKLAGFDVKNEVSQLTSHIPLVSHKDKVATAAKDQPNPNKIIANLQDELNSANGDIKSKDQEIQSLNAKIKEMQTTSTDEKQVAQKDAAQAKAQTIAQVYQSMDPAKAAAILSNMKEDEAAGYLNMMNNQTKAKIFEQMSADKAAKITPLLTAPPTAEKTQGN